MPRSDDPPLCPSGSASMQGAEVFAIVGADQPGRAAYLDRPVALDEATLALAAPLDPAHVFRVAVPCAAKGCAHFEAGACQIAARMTERMEAAVDSLPRCAIRPACRWWRQEGAAACTRCPQIATTPLAPTDTERLVAGKAGGGRDG